VDIDVTTRAILKQFLLPPGLLIVLLLTGWLFARKVFGRLLILLAILLFYGLTTPSGVDWLASQLETVPALGGDDARRSRADAVVVFLAGTRRLNPEFNGADSLDAMSLERLDYALHLHRETGLPIIVSGGPVKEGNGADPVARLAADWLQRQAGVSALAVDSSSRDTRENALRTAEILDQQGLGRVLLVTHAYHMPRARLSARAAGLDVVPAPFGFIHKPPEYRPESDGPGTVAYLADWLPSSGALRRSYLVLHEMAGLVWYGLTR
jgi:uncharacterized SAM-binding protein YcdF (DUF218 family)